MCNRPSSAAERRLTCVCVRVLCNECVKQASVYVYMYVCTYVCMYVCM